jgi:prepilin-type N-terminal cleavage/methylation domain-containing protein
MIVPVAPNDESSLITCGLKTQHIEPETFIQIILTVPYRVRGAYLHHSRLKAYGTFIALAFRQRKTEKHLAFHSLFIIYQRRFTMLQKMTRTNEKGFTLIELMIVIAIIGILAAIAIPNFISYRNKSFCSSTESDANNVAARIADWYAIPTHTALVTVDQINVGTATLSNKNTATILGNPNDTITITVTDASTRCPTEYKNAMPATASPMGYWTSAAGNTYVKLMRR